MIFSIDGAYKNRGIHIENEDIFKRISKAFISAKKDQLTVTPEYLPSADWSIISNICHGTLIDCIVKNDTVLLSNILNNFFRNKCATGLFGLNMDIENNSLGDEVHPTLAKDFFNDCLHRLELWLELTEYRTPVQALCSPEIGNPPGFYVDEHFIRAGSDYQHYYSTIISRILKNSNKPSVLEIGGGFGGMAYFLLRDSPNLTYIDVDIPENLALASFYLLSAFPDKKFALYGEIDIDNLNPLEWDAILLPNFALKKIPSGSIELFFNSYSLSEMSLETVHEYFKHIDRITKKYIYHVNHTKGKSTVNSSKFPINRERFDLISKAPAFWNFGRQPNMDEYEHIYRDNSLHYHE